MYCNAACKKKHKSKHKKACERRVAELHDEKLFKQPPPNEDCPICFLRLPFRESGKVYMACCGKMICIGCIFTVQSRAYGARRPEDDVCPFCRTPPPNTPDGAIKRYEERMELNDANAIYNMGVYYSRGQYGLTQDRAKALESWHRAGELGSAAAYSSIGYAYKTGNGVEMDKKKATQYYELATIGGDPYARHNLGCMEYRVGNKDRALKHYMIATGSGCNDSLEGIKLMHKNGDATKDDYAKALRSYQAYLDEIKSDQRDKAVVYSMAGHTMMVNCPNRRNR